MPASSASPAFSARIIVRTVWSILACFLGGCTTPAVTTRAPECHLPPRTIDSSRRFALPSRIHYLQRDARWASDPIGGSGKPLQNVGCAICCLSMALAEYGIHRTPGQLNDGLKRINGYNEKGWVYWSAIEPLTGGKAHVEYMHNPALAGIERALALGQPVLVKVAPTGMLQHWVLLAGRDGREFLMKDPLDGTKSLKHLSSLGSQILAVRIVKKGKSPDNPGDRNS
jgi:hypothetical protein